MLTKEGYKKIAGNWKGTVYQLWDRYQVRFPLLLKHINVFKDKNVLEIGCNAGLAAYHITQVAKSYIGVEAEEGYYQQSLETKKQIENKNVEFKNMSIKSYIKRAARGDFEINVNAAYLSYVLYHFSDKEVQMFEKTILPKLEVIIVQSRYAERNKKGRRKHNSYAFWHPDNVEKYLNKNGLCTLVEIGPRNKFHFIVGVKSEILKKIYHSVENSLRYKEYTLEDIDKGAWRIVKNGDWSVIKTEEKADGDKGSSEVHTEKQSKTAQRRSTRSGTGRVAEGKPRSTTQRQTSSQRPSRAIRPKNQGDGSKSVLQPVVEKSTKQAVCNTNIQKVEKTSPNRRITKTDKNSGSKGQLIV